MSNTVLISGANRGIGLEFVRQYLDDDWTVIGTTRDMDRADKLRTYAKELDGTLHIAKMDLTENSQIEATCKSVSDHVEELDLLINNAGYLAGKDDFEELSVEDLFSSIDVNCLGHFRVTQAFLPLLEEAKGNVVFITSLMSSIEDNQSGGRYPYRISKTALNMLGRTFAMDYTDEGIYTLLMNPGWVKTDLGNPGAKVEVEDSVAGMREVIENLDEDLNGQFVNYKGEIEPW
mgnify:CR=1 FL=1